MPSKRWSTRLGRSNCRPEHPRGRRNPPVEHHRAQREAELGRTIKARTRARGGLGRGLLENDHRAAAAGGLDPLVRLGRLSGLVTGAAAMRHLRRRGAHAVAGGLRIGGVVGAEGAVGGGVAGAQVDHPAGEHQQDSEHDAQWTGSGTHGRRSYLDFDVRHNDRSKHRSFNPGGVRDIPEAGPGLPLMQTLRSRASMSYDDVRRASVRAEEVDHATFVGVGRGARVLNARPRPSLDAGAGRPRCRARPPRWFTRRARD